MPLIARGKYSATPLIGLTAKQLDTRNRVLDCLREGSLQEEDVACFCDGYSDLLIAEKDRYGLPVRTLLCQSCGIMRTSPRLTEESTAVFYGRDYRSLYMPGEQDAEALFEAEKRNGTNYLPTLIKALAPGDLLYEIGTGAGGFLAPFKAAGIRTVGCDLGAEYLETARKKGIDAVHGHVDEIVKHTGELADCICMIHVFEHVLDLRAELEKISAALKPGKFLLLEVPAIHCLRTNYGSDVMRYLQNAHTYHFTNNTLTYVLEACGFRVLEATPNGVAIALKLQPGEEFEGRSTVGTREARDIAFFLLELEKTLALKQLEAAPMTPSSLPRADRES